MNVPLPGAGGPEIVTQERLLQDAAERIHRIRYGRLAVQVHLSRLRPQNRQEGHIRIALRMLEPMVNAYNGQMFLLTNSDIVFMLREPNMTDVENMIYKLRALFSKDPLTYGDRGDGRDNFCSWFDLGTSDYDDFLAMSKRATADAQIRVREMAAVPERRSIDAKGLGDLIAKLSGMDVLPMVRRQSAIVISPASEKATVLFHEFYVSVQELQKALAPDINLLDNRWLFQHLSQTLDARVLSALQGMSLTNKPNTYALNMNVSTALSANFERFEDAVDGVSGISVEFQVLDVMADSRSYYTARDRLRQSGHKVAIDGLSELTLQLMDVSQFDADLYKVTWTREMREPEHAAAVGAAIKPVGIESILLARCDSEASINWGLEHGIQRFQGMYVDTMLTAYAMQGCTRPGTCTVQQCATRRAVIGGPLRRQCCSLDVMDASPVLKAPKVSTTQRR